MIFRLIAAISAAMALLSAPAAQAQAFITC